MFIIVLYNVYERDVEYNCKVLYGQTMYRKGRIIMKKSNKKLVMAASLVLGITVMTSASLANYATSNGYEVGKTALKGLLKNENYSSELSLSMTVDDDVISDFKVTEKYDRDGDVKLNRTESNYYYNDSNPDRTYVSYFQDNSDISIYNKGTEDENTYIYHYGNIEDLGWTPGRGMFDEFAGEDEEEADRNAKFVRFAELAADTMVGDLKNNVVYVSGDDDSATYEMQLSGMQIPELVNAGVSLLFSESGIDEDDPILSKLGQDPVIKSVSLTFTVDNENRLSDAAFKVTAAGNGHEAAVDMSAKLYDYGTTKPERVDISSLKNVNKPDMSDEAVTYIVGEDNIEIEYED